MIITSISFASGSEQERALLLVFIVCYVIDVFPSRIVFIMIQATISENLFALLESNSLCARNCFWFYVRTSTKVIIFLAKQW